jgi:3',5'-cyclic AMP phosphodiesterase CpdA
MSMKETEETRAKEKGTVTWLHLSDLHACRPKTGWEAKGILDKLEEDFEKLQGQYGLKPDLIFFTGDAVFGQIGKDEGKSIKEQFKEAADLFENIRTSFSPEVPKENVFLVPGNHDVNRDNVLPILHKGLDMLSEQKHEEVKKQLSMPVYGARYFIFSK